MENTYPLCQDRYLLYITIVIAIHISVQFPVFLLRSIFRKLVVLDYLLENPVGFI